jgi:ferritin-like metal-binding protein YciE
MKTADNKIQLLLEQTCLLYNSEKEITGLFEALEVNITEAPLKEGIVREAEENKRQCARLEGLLSILRHHTITNCTSTAQENFIKQFSTALKRVVFKHSDFGYRAAIFAAITLGQNEIASLFRNALSNNSIVTVK